MNKTCSPSPRDAVASNRGAQAPTSAVSPVRPAPNAGTEVHVLPVQRNVYMLASGAGNVTMQVGEDGIVLVDTNHGALTSKVLAAIRTVSDKPLHTIVNTNLHRDHTGGNQALVKLGAGGRAVRLMAHENVFNKMMAAAAAANPRSDVGVPMSAYFTPRAILLNGEAIFPLQPRRTHRRRHNRPLPRSDCEHRRPVLADLHPNRSGERGTVNGIITRSPDPRATGARYQKGARMSPRSRPAVR